MKTFSQQLRASILKAGESRYSLARRAGVAQSILCRFIQGGDLRTNTVDRIVCALDLELKPRQRGCK